MDKQLILKQVEDLLQDADVLDSSVVAKIDAILWVLYPRGVKPVDYASLVRAVRVLDRLCDMIEPANQGQGQDQGQGQALAAAVPDQPAVQEQLPLLPDELAAGVVERIDDDTTSPIEKPPLFTQSTSGDKPWTSVGNFSLGSHLSERRAPGQQYTSIFKCGPYRED